MHRKELICALYFSMWSMHFREVWCSNSFFCRSFQCTMIYFTVSREERLEKWHTLRWNNWWAYWAQRQVELYSYCSAITWSASSHNINRTSNLQVARVLTSNNELCYQNPLLTDNLRTCPWIIQVNAFCLICRQQ